MREIEVFNATRTYLAVNGFTVLQLVPPGGQAPISVTFDDGTRKRTCYPDLIAWKDGTLWIGELKAGFSGSDYEKLLAILSFGDAQLRECALAQLGNVVTPEMPIEGILCHSDIESCARIGVHQLIFQRQTSTLVRPRSVGTR